MIKKIQDAKIKKQTVVLRLDLNVPYSNGKSSDISRIEKTKKTVHHLIKDENKIVILSHFGRPNG
ncbi:phosphoglycerate kinase [Paracoccaceae bacterium]|nr:phosphoglycerate kinase [Paracoccaceae bacterium]